MVYPPFRELFEPANHHLSPPLPVPEALPRVPPNIPSKYLQEQALALDALTDASNSLDARSAIAFLQGGESEALAHLRQYLARGLPHSYKRTRNGLVGYWLWFELLWRDYFRFLHLQHGRALYRARGLGPVLATPHDDQSFAAWCAGQTGQPLVDAAMRELAATGYLGNRVRQVAASYLIHDLGCDWRAGAAWFESQLLDYDVYSNQGNWLYIAGRGTDPRGGRRFDPVKQAATYDADGAYQRLWGKA